MKDGSEPCAPILRVMPSIADDRAGFSPLRFAATLSLALGIATSAGLCAREAAADKYQDKNLHWWCEFDNAKGGTIEAGPFDEEPDCTDVCNDYANAIHCDDANRVVRRTPPPKPPGKEAPST